MHVNTILVLRYSKILFGKKEHSQLIADELIIDEFTVDELVS